MTAQETERNSRAQDLTLILTEVSSITYWIKLDCIKE